MVWRWSSSPPRVTPARSSRSRPGMSGPSGRRPGFRPLVPARRRAARPARRARTRACDRLLRHRGRIRGGTTGGILRRPGQPVLAGAGGGGPDPEPDSPRRLPKRPRSQARTHGSREVHSRLGRRAFGGRLRSGGLRAKILRYRPCILAFTSKRRQRSSSGTPSSTGASSLRSRHHSLCPPSPAGTARRW